MKIGCLKLLRPQDFRPMSILQGGYVLANHLSRVSLLLTTAGELAHVSIATSP